MKSNMVWVLALACVGCATGGQSKQEPLPLKSAPVATQPVAAEPVIVPGTQPVTITREPEQKQFPLLSSKVASDPATAPADELPTPPSQPIDLKPAPAKPADVPATPKPVSVAPTTKLTTKPTTQASTKPAPKPRVEADAATPAIKNKERHEQFLARIKQGPVGVLMLGDSITDGWDNAGIQMWRKFQPLQPANFGISGDRTEHVLWRIQNGELDGIAPKAVVIMIGTNNTGGDKPEWIAAGVTKIVETVHAKLPNTKVLLLAVFPRDTKDSGARKKVTAVNDIIKNLHDGNKTVFLDLTDKFLDAEGNIPKDIMPDGLHPNAKGYNIWYDAMMPTLEGLMK